MGDLVLLLRDLIKSSGSGQTIDLDVLFRHINFDCLFGFVLARAGSPCSAEAVARAPHFLGIRTAVSCAQPADDRNEFPRCYSRRLLSPLHLDSRPAAFGPFRREMGKVSSRPRTVSRPGVSRCPRQCVDHATRPAAIVQVGRLGRFSYRRQSVSDSASKRSALKLSREPMSPRVTLTLSTSRSSCSGPDLSSQRIGSPAARLLVPTPEYHGVELDPIRPIIPCFDMPRVFDAPFGNELDTDPKDSVRADPSAPKGTSRKHVFDRELNRAVREHAVNIPQTPPHYCSACENPSFRGNALLSSLSMP